MCYDRPNDNTALLASLLGNKDSGIETAALMNGGMGGQWNNPFIYLVWMMFANRFFGNGYGDSQNAEVMDRINSLGSQMNTNQNTNLMMDAISGNHEALHQLSSALGVNTATLQGAINGVQNAITQVGGQVGFSSERVINSVLMGNKDLTSAIQNCCCNTQQSILKMGYEGQIQTMNQTNQLQERLTGIANGISQGFSSTAYETQKQTCDIINAINSDGQATRALLQNHWQTETSQALQDAKFEISQLKQNQTLINALQNGCGCSN